jgi:hypothetical protein
MAEDLHAYVTSAGSVADLDQATAETNFWVSNGMILLLAMTCAYEDLGSPKLVGQAGAVPGADLSLVSVTYRSWLEEMPEAVMRMIVSHYIYGRVHELLDEKGFLNDARGYMRTVSPNASPISMALMAAERSMKGPAFDERG